MIDPLDFYPRDRRDDQLSAARGIGLAGFAGLAFLFFIAAGLFAATENEDWGAVCAILAFGCTVVALVIGGNNAR